MKENRLKTCYKKDLGMVAKIRFKFERIYKLLVSRKSSENQKFLDDFRGNRIYLTHSNWISRGSGNYIP